MACGDPMGLIVHGTFVAAIYDGVARAARDWVVHFLQNRKPPNLGAALATLPRAQEIVGGIEVKLTTNTRLLESFAADYDSGRGISIGGRQGAEDDVDQQRGRGRRGGAVADRQSRPVAHESAGAASSRRAVRAGA